MSADPYELLAKRLDALPNGYPPSDDGSELHILECLFSPQEAALAAQLRLTPETPTQLAERIGGDPQALKGDLKGMARKGLIKAAKVNGQLGFRLLPFVVGIYENQLGSIDAEFAELFENYYKKAFGEMLATEPAVHRVIPVNESVRNEMEVRPYESAAQIVANANAWGVQECICRKQKALIGDPCEHSMGNCLVLHARPGVFDNHPSINPLTQEQAMSVLNQAADEGLVHSVSNTQEQAWYICNCCTCSCGILRGMVDLGIANVVARSAYVNQVEQDLCIGCSICVDYCQFGALTLIDVASVNATRCVGCGVCVPCCPEGALQLIPRPREEIKPTPTTEMRWLQERADGRGMDLRAVL